MFISHRLQFERNVSRDDAGVLFGIMHDYSLEAFQLGAGFSVHWPFPAIRIETIPEVRFYPMLNKILQRTRRTGAVFHLIVLTRACHAYMLNSNHAHKKAIPPMGVNIA